MASNWNFCLAQARGDFFILLSDDDLLAPEALEGLLAPLRSGNAALSYSPFVTIDEQGEPIMRSNLGASITSGQDFIRHHLARRLDVMPSGVLARTAPIRQLGGFPETGTTSDLGLRLLLATQGEVACLELPLLKYRVHQSNLSGKVPDVIASHLEFLRWTQNRRELLAYKREILGFVHRAILGNGFRSSLQGNAVGTNSSLEGLQELGLSVGERLLSKWLILGGRWRFVRRLMNVRDAYHRKKQQRVLID